MLVFANQQSVYFAYFVLLSSASVWFFIALAVVIAMTPDLILRVLENLAEERKLNLLIAEFRRRTSLVAMRAESMRTSTAGTLRSRPTTVEVFSEDGPSSGFIGQNSTLAASMITSAHSKPAQKDQEGENKPLQPQPQPQVQPKPQPKPQSVSRPPPPKPSGETKPQASKAVRLPNVNPNVPVRLFKNSPLLNTNKNVQATKKSTGGQGTSSSSTIRIQTPEGQIAQRSTSRISRAGAESRASVSNKVAPSTTTSRPGTAITPGTVYSIARSRTASPSAKSRVASRDNENEDINNVEV